LSRDRRVGIDVERNDCRVIDSSDSHVIIVEFEGGGPGAAKTPTLAYDDLEIDLPFTTSAGGVGAAAP